jgi:hypothetical protein
MENLHDMNEDDPDRRMKFCERFQPKVHEDEKVVGKIAWFDEAAFKLNGAVNRHNCIGLQKIHTYVCEQGDQFTKAHCLTWTVIQWFNLAVFFLRNSYWSNVPHQASNIHFISSTRMSQSTLSKMAHHHTIRETSEATSVKPYRVNG